MIKHISTEKTTLESDNHHLEHEKTLLELDKEVLQGRIQQQKEQLSALQEEHKENVLTLERVRSEIDLSERKSERTVIEMKNILAVATRGSCRLRQRAKEAEAKIFALTRVETSLRHEIICGKSQTARLLGEVAHAKVQATVVKDQLEMLIEEQHLTVKKLGDTVSEVESVRRAMEEMDQGEEEKVVRLRKEIEANESKLAWYKEQARRIDTEHTIRTKGLTDAAEMVLLKAAVAELRYKKEKEDMLKVWEEKQAAWHKEKRQFGRLMMNKVRRWHNQVARQRLVSQWRQNCASERLLDLKAKVVKQLFDAKSAHEADKSRWNIMRGELQEYIEEQKEDIKLMMMASAGHPHTIITGVHVGKPKHEVNNLEQKEDCTHDANITMHQLKLDVVSSESKNRHEVLKHIQDRRKLKHAGMSPEEAMIMAREDTKKRIAAFEKRTIKLMFEEKKFKGLYILGRRQIYLSTARVFRVWSRYVMIRLLNVWKRNVVEPKLHNQREKERVAHDRDMKQRLSKAVDNALEVAHVSELEVKGLSRRIRKLLVLLVAVTCAGRTHNAKEKLRMSISNWVRGCHFHSTGQDWKREVADVQEALNKAKNEVKLERIRASLAEEKAIDNREVYMAETSRVVNLQREIEMASMEAAKERLVIKKEKGSLEKEIKKLDKALSTCREQLAHAHGELTERVLRRRGDTEAREEAVEEASKWKDMVQKLTRALDEEHNDVISLRSTVQPNHLLCIKLHKNLAHLLTFIGGNTGSGSHEPEDGNDLIPKTPTQTASKDFQLLTQCDTWLRGVRELSGVPKDRTKTDGFKAKPALSQQGGVRTPNKRRGSLGEP